MFAIRNMRGCEGLSFSWIVGAAAMSTKAGRSVDPIDHNHNTMRRSVTTSCNREAV